MKSKSFLDWLATGGGEPLEEYLSDSELTAMGVSNDAEAAALSELIVRVIARVAFEGASPVDREMLRGLASLYELELHQLNLQMDTWDRVSNNAEPDQSLFPVRTKRIKPTALFTGRRRGLEHLVAALSDGHTTVASQVVTGLGGVGKTQLVAKLVEDHSEGFDVVAWFDAGADLPGHLASLGRQLGFEGSLAERAAAVEQWLASTDRRCLVVLDNVEDLDVLRGFQAGPSVRLVATTRLAVPAVSDFGAVLRLDVFDRDESIQYLQKRASCAEPEADRLAEALGDLPIALGHAAAYCELNGTTIDEYLDLLGSLRFQELFKDNLDGFYEQVVHRTWEVSIAQVGDLAARVLQLSSYLHFAGVPVDAFAGLVDDPAAPESEARLREAAGELVRWSLAEWTGDRSLAVHRLVQKVVRDSATGDDAFRAACQFVGRVSELEPDDPAQWPDAQRFVPHIAALLETAPPCGLELDQQLLMMASQSMMYLVHAGQASTACQHGNLATAFAEDRLGQDHPDTLAAWASLAASYKSAGRFDDAITIGERVASKCEEVLGERDPITLMARGNLASSYGSVGRFDEAINILDWVAARCEEVLGERDPVTLMAWVNLASNYGPVGRVDEAINILERVACQYQDIVGDCHPEALQIWANLGSGYWSVGRFDEAIAIGERVASKCEEVLGDCHPATLRSWDNLVAHYHSVSRYSEAIAIGERVAPIARRRSVITTPTR